MPNKGWLTLFIVLLCLSPFDRAEARRLGSRTEELLFVSTTSIRIDGEHMALCHLVETRSVMRMAFLRELKGYALAGNLCESERYRAVYLSEIRTLKAQGAIPNEIPSVPSLTPETLLAGHWGWSVALILIVSAGVTRYRIARRRKARTALMGDAPASAKAILEVMCHAAKADGRVVSQEIEAIRGVAERLTGQKFSAEQVHTMAALAEVDLEPKDYQRLAKGLTNAEKDQMMLATLQTISVDGKLDEAEQVVVAKLANALNMPQEKVHQLLIGITIGNT